MFRVYTGTWRYLDGADGRCLVVSRYMCVAFTNLLSRRPISVYAANKTGRMDNHPANNPASPLPPRLRMRAAMGVVAIAVAGIVVGFLLCLMLVPKTIQAPACEPPTEIRVYFSPKGGAKDAIIDLINRATGEILVAIYSFTDPDLAYALIAAHRRGVAVQIIHDRSQNSARGSQTRRLTAAGVDVRSFALKSQLHHKFMIVDACALVTGSMNWTRNGETKNAENTLVLPNSPATAAEFRDYFMNRLFNKPPPAIP